VVVEMLASSTAFGISGGWSWVVLTVRLCIIYLTSAFCEGNGGVVAHDTPDWMSY
jgi:hypothetical protein